MVRFVFCDLRFAIGVESASFAAALASKASPSKQAGQLPPGPSPESFAPHCGHVFTAGISRSFEWAPPVTAQKLENGYIQSHRTRETGHDFDAMQRDHEPTLNPSQEGNWHDADECMLPLGGRGWVVSWKAAFRLFPHALGP